MNNLASESVTSWRNVIFVSPVRWRVRFLAVTSLVFFAQFALGVHDARRDLALRQYQALPFFVVSLICSCLVVGLCSVLDWPRRRIANAGISLVWFVVELTVSTLLLDIMKERVFPYPYIPEPLHAYSPGRLLAILITDVVISIVLVVLIDALARVLDERRRAAESVARQAARFQLQLLIAEEESRALVSRYLHDRVQAHLIRLGAQLGQIADRLPPQDAAMVTSVRDVLEEVRGIDVQGAARALAPSLEASGLTASLQQLSSPYEGVTVVDIHIDASLDSMHADQGFYGDGPSVTLAVYRIVEQGLLNAIKHGQAQHITIRVTQPDSSRVHIDVSDDGNSPAGETGLIGGGLATVDGWTRAFHGSWALHLNPNNGARLTAELRSVGAEIEPHSVSDPNSQNARS